MLSVIRLIICLVLLAPEVLVTGHQMEDDNLFHGAAGLQARVNRHIPQTYNLYLEPVNSGAFRNFDPEKRSRLFVGKRIIEEYPSEDGEDYFLLSSENSGPFAENEFKRNHLFVGKRGSPRFVGKRSVASQLLTRRKRFAGGELKDLEVMRAGKEEAETTGLNNEDHMWKIWMADEEEGSGSEKRSRMFVGKRRGFKMTEADDKRSRLFVGRRAQTEAGYEDSGSRTLFPEKVELTETAKRSRLFVGKRPVDPHYQNSSEPSAAENGDEIQSPPPGADDSGSEKRARLFPGKRPAPGFVGKRQN